jgi:hypothetical protein
MTFDLIQLEIPGLGYQDTEPVSRAVKPVCRSLVGVIKGGSVPATQTMLCRRPEEGLTRRDSPWGRHNSPSMHLPAVDHSIGQLSGFHSTNTKNTKITIAYAQPKSLVERVQ